MTSDTNVQTAVILVVDDDPDSRDGYFPHHIDEVPVPAYGAVVFVRWD